MNNKTNKIIHIARIQPRGRDLVYLLLRKTEESVCFSWFEENCNQSEGEIETGIFATTIEEAIRLARSRWHSLAFRTVMCGFRYTLPERDEHGLNALFYQMSASYASSNGQYFDEELGHLCIVQNASQEALNLNRRYH